MGTDGSRQRLWSLRPIDNVLRQGRPTGPVPTGRTSWRIDGETKEERRGRDYGGKLLNPGPATFGSMIWAALFTDPFYKAPS